jgi:hypothetical protein
MMTSQQDHQMLDQKRDWAKVAQKLITFKKEALITRVMALCERRAVDWTKMQTMVQSTPPQAIHKKKGLGFVNTKHKSLERKRIDQVRQATRDNYASFFSINGDVTAVTFNGGISSNGGIWKKIDIDEINESTTVISTESTSLRDFEYSIKQESLKMLYEPCVLGVMSVDDTDCYPDTPLDDLMAKLTGGDTTGRSIVPHCTVQLAQGPSTIKTTVIFAISSDEFIASIVTDWRVPVYRTSISGETSQYGPHADSPSTDLC